MKIAILTQPLKSNYGGMLQAFALQKVIKRCGHEVVTIDRRYSQRSLLRTFLSLSKRLLFRVFSKKIIKDFSVEQYETIFRNTSEFIQQNIVLSEVIDTDDKIKKHFNEHKYDAVVVGSDQTWRPCYSPSIYNFYLDFLEDSEIKKIAYASSFGVDNWEYSKLQSARCSALAKKFDAVSVRETFGVELCRKYFGIASECVLDPTLLLSKGDYIAHFNIGSTPNSKGKLFTYILDSSCEKTDIINIVSRNLGLERFKHQPEMSLERFESKNTKDYVYPSVKGWVKSFHDADYVVTDSFHGCVFSIIFNKPFLVIANEGRGLSRFKSLLEIFNLEKRLIFKPTDVTMEIISRPIDWLSVDRILEKQKKSSIAFLKGALQDDNARL